MRRLPLIIALLALALPVLGSEDTRPFPRAEITAEYRQDTLDYDDVDKRFFRESVRLTFGKSSASFTHVHVGMTKENRFTWNVWLRGLSPYCDAIIGNYYANFGAGLLVGKKMALSPDPFTRSLAVSRGDSFTPCTSGNPIFSFMGIAAGLRYSSSIVSLSLHGYYSFRNRFVRNDRHYADITGTSFGSILIRTKKDYRYSEPVEINDCGYSFLMRIAGHFTVQSYFIYSFIKRSGTRTMIWDYDDRIIPCGEKNFYGYGFYLQYRDDYILMFIDLCFPHRVTSTAGIGTRTIRGFAVMYSLAFRHRACRISVTGKQADKNYYSPYSSGKSCPETAWTAALSMVPSRNITLGASFFTEKNIMPSGSDQFLKFTRRERLFMKYNARLKGSCSIRLDYVERDKKKGKERHLRLASSSRIYIMKSILFTLGGTVQRKVPGHYSGSLAAGIRFTLFNTATINFRYSRFFIATDTSIHAATSRSAGTINRTMAVTSSSNIIMGGLQIRFSGCRISFDYLHHFNRRRTLQSRIDASGTLLL